MGLNLICVLMLNRLNRMKEDISIGQVEKTKCFITRLPAWYARQNGVSQWFEFEAPNLLGEHEQKATSRKRRALFLC
jgi:hypothetical protein